MHDVDGWFMVVVGCGVELYVVQVQALCAAVKCVAYGSQNLRTQLFEGGVVMACIATIVTCI